MERIAPLAKILAEANGIDWQKLRGTGDGGTVVEQDILNYLSRIMSGEEEPPSTPVDVPPPDWNGDMNAMPDLSGLSADQLARAGVESDIASLLSPAQLTPSVPATASADLDEDMDFELDDVEPEAAVPAPSLPPTPATPSLGGWEWNAASTTIEASVPDGVEMPNLEMPGLDMPAAAAAITAPPVNAPAFQFGLPAEAAPAQSEPAAMIPASPALSPTISAPAVEAATAVGLGSLLSRLYQSPAPTEAPAAPAQAAQPAMDTMAFHAPMDADAGDVHSGPVLDTGTSWPAPSTPEASAAEVSAPEVTAPELAAVDESTPVAAALELAVAEPAAPESVTPEEPVTAGSEVAAHHDEPAHTPTEPESEAAAPALPEPEALHVIAAPVAMTQPAVTPAAPAQRVGDAVWFGTYLRRDAEVGTLGDLHRQIVAALGQELPLGLLVARAAQRHAADLGLTTVALQGDGSARSVAGDTLRAAADAMHHDYQGTPDLLVVDAGAHGLDDLHYPHTTTLSVGRVQDGRAALTLNGNVDTVQGAAFLAAVADTLGQPVLLLL
ncbi:E3 binding domain-containing protein [Deinococcus sp.]|uniref:E3 binding domain-containing protein n=1 Tax=Deinococcus sp. TaxID=47478 RepID=UPI002869D669|nr:E3 binding domain-containing protein [Deinococcus sp.]